MGGQSAGGMKASNGCVGGQKGGRLVGQIVEAAGNQRLPGTAPDTSALLAAFEANRCRSGLAYR
jgi:hypothetical protein